MKMNKQWIEQFVVGTNNILRPLWPISFWREIKTTCSKGLSMFSGSNESRWPCPPKSNSSVDVRICMLCCQGSRGRLPGSLCGVSAADPRHPASWRCPGFPHWTGIVYIKHGKRFKFLGTIVMGDWWSVCNICMRSVDFGHNHFKIYLYASQFLSLCIWDR